VPLQFPSESSPFHDRTTQLKREVYSAPFVAQERMAALNRQSS